MNYDKEDQLIQMDIDAMADRENEHYEMLCEMHREKWGLKPCHYFSDKIEDAYESQQSETTRAKDDHRSQ